MKPQLTLGVIGHVDHGKTALVRALTGVETDRLREERERGLSIVPDLYYGGLYSVNEATCESCHAKAGADLSAFNPAAEGSGEMRGDDGTFSFHVLKEAALVVSGEDNRQINQDLIAGGVVRTKEEGDDLSPYPSLQSGGDSND